MCRPSCTKSGVWRAGEKQRTDEERIRIRNIVTRQVDSWGVVVKASGGEYDDTVARVAEAAWSAAKGAGILLICNHGVLRLGVSRIQFSGCLLSSVVHVVE